jgi:sugar O-acyltransferase (sialic acid O-acetyltransferase NeuD family)
MRDAARRREPLLIFPCNGNGIEALDCLGDAYRCAGFVDDAPDKQGSTRCGHRVLTRGALVEQPDAAVLAVPGSPTSFRARRALIEGLGVDDKRFARVVHPAARVSPLAQVGHNVLIMAGVVVTSDAVIGNHVCILPNTVIHHGVVVGDHALVGSNVTVAGDAVIGENAYVGSGSRIMNGVRIGDGALVGLGSNVIRSVAPGTTVAGNPAEELRRRTEKES